MIAQSFSRASFEPATSLFWLPDPQIISLRMRKYAAASFQPTCFVVLLPPSLTVRFTVLCAGQHAVL